MNFDKKVERRGTFCEKYDDLNKKFGADDILPLWVADMDFAVSDAIQEALRKRVKHPIYGYTFSYDDYFNSIIRWQKKQHNWDVDRVDILPINSIVTALKLMVLNFSKNGEGVIIQTPIYPPFISAILGQNRRLLENALLRVDDRYEIDFEDFEKKAKEAKLFLFCSPHNPTGRVFSEDELKRLAMICKKNGVIIVSDEVHADIVYRGFTHTPMAKIAKDITITLNAPSKTFNIAGIVNAYMIVQDEDLKKEAYKLFKQLSLTTHTPFSLTATIAAYTKSDIWYEELVQYLEQNYLYIEERLKDIPQIKATKIEGTFLLWLDCRGLGLYDESLSEFFIQKAKLGLNSGKSFGAVGEGFMRLNFATPRSLLKEAIDRLQDAIGV